MNSPRVMGISCNIIKPKEVAKLHPLVNIHDLVGALHLPADAVVSPPDVNHALAVAAAGQGISHTLSVTGSVITDPLLCSQSLFLFPLL